VPPGARRLRVSVAAGSNVCLSACHPIRRSPAFLHALHRAKPSPWPPRRPRTPQLPPPTSRRLLHPCCRISKTAISALATTAKPPSVRELKRERDTGFEPATVRLGTDREGFTGGVQESQTIGLTQKTKRRLSQESLDFGLNRSPFVTRLLPGQPRHPLNVRGPEPAVSERLLTVGEVAERLGLSTATLQKLCGRGLLKHVRVLNAIGSPPAMSRHSSLSTAPHGCLNLSGYRSLIRHRCPWSFASAHSGWGKDEARSCHPDESDQRGTNGHSVGAHSAHGALRSAQESPRARRLDREQNV